MQPASRIPWRCSHASRGFLRQKTARPSAMARRPRTRAAEGRGVGGAEPCRSPQVHPPAFVRRARRRACERRAAAAGWQVPAEPTMPRLNSQVLVSGF